MQRWEHDVVTLVKGQGESFDQALILMETQGFELVSVVATTVHGDTTGFILFFKRPRPADIDTTPKAE